MASGSAIGGLHRLAGLVATKPRAGRGEAGFTLLEIIVVLVLFGLISAVLIGGSGALLRAIGREDVENTALGAIAAARHEAVLGGQTLELRLDEKARVLDWGAGRAVLAGEEKVRLLPPVRDRKSVV